LGAVIVPVMLSVAPAPVVWMRTCRVLLRVRLPA
jgi:hypothetical protein